MSLKGEISLIRTLTDHAVWQGDLAVRGAWIDLLLRANTDPATLLLRGELVTLKRGQLAWSINNLAKKWGVCESRASKMLAYLQQLGCILVESSHRRTVITICNYEVYQTPSLPTPPPTSVDTSPPTPVTHSPPTAPPTSVPSVGTDVATDVGTAVGQSIEIGDTHTPRARGLTPSWAEVEAFAVASQVDVEFARAWFERKSNSRTHGFGTLLDWRSDLLPYWHRNGAGAKTPAAREPGSAANGHARPKTLGAEVMDLKRRWQTLSVQVDEHVANENSAAFDGTTLADSDLNSYRRLQTDLRQVEAGLRSIPKDAPEGWMRDLRRQAFERACAEHPGNPESTAYDEHNVTDQDRTEYLALRRECGV